MSFKNNISPTIKRMVLSVCAASCVFLWVPLYVLQLSINDINFNFLDFLFSCLIATGAASVVFFLSASLLTRLRLDWLGSALLYFILFWTCIAGFMLPLVEQAGMVSPDKLVTASTHLMIVAAAALALTLLTFTKLKTAAQAFLAILTLTTVGAALPVLIKGGALLNRFTGLSSTDNVVVLSFDGLAGNVAKQVLEENPELKASLKDLTFYDNAVASAPATSASLRAELFGNINYRTLTDPEGKPVAALSAQANSIRREQAQGADVVTYGGYSAFNDNAADTITPLTLGNDTLAQRASTALSFYPYVAARIGTAHTAQFVSIQIAALKKQYTLDSKARRYLEHQGDKWDATNTLHSEDMVNFTENLHVGSSQRSVRFLHLLHTHFPVDLDENCTYRSADKAWFKSNQNYQGVFNETHCALKQTAALVDKLKALGIYDQTTFIVKSDHGAAAPYMDKTPDLYAINNHPLWGYNRYRPLLMIKPREHTSEALTYNSMIASLSDLAKTLCLQAPGKPACDAYHGVDLLADDAKDQSQLVYVDVVKDENSTFAFDTHITIEVQRKPDFKAAMEETGKVVFTDELKLYTQRKHDLAQVYAALQAYHQAHGKYPSSQGFDGRHSTWGKDSSEWISDLVPTYLPSLPLDPADAETSTPQYGYQSDGENFKMIALGKTPSCAYAARENPELVDPARNCWGFGYWSEGARLW